MPKVVSLDRAPTTQLTVMTMKRDGEALGTIVMVVRDSVKAPTMVSWFMTDYSWVPPGMYVQRNVIQGNLLTLQRNEAVQRMAGDWLMFVDDDMVWSSDAIGKLVAARDEIDADIIGALCFRRSPPHQPTMYMREHSTSGGYNFLEDWTSDIVEVDATGMAFVIIAKRVFERIAGSVMPTPEARLISGPPNFFRWDGVLGEDLRFCQDAKASGCRIFVDTRIEVGHLSDIEIRQRHFLMEMASRDPDLIAARQELNAKMSLPTLSAEEVRRRLGWN